MKLSQFRFNLPKELIAEKPPRNRDDARMLVLHRDTGKVEHRIFKDFIDYVEADDVVVANNTKVFPALLEGEKEKTGREGGFAMKTGTVGIARYASATSSISAPTTPSSLRWWTTQRRADAPYASSTTAPTRISSR